MRTSPDGDNTTEKELYIYPPEGTADAILPGDVRTLKEGGGPCPLGDDDGGGQAGLDHAAGGAVEVWI